MRRRAPAALVAGLCLLAAAPAGRVVRTLDLAAPFATRSPWRLTATHTPDRPDPLGGPGDRIPGMIALCLSKDGGRTCAAGPGEALHAPWLGDEYQHPHFLEALAIVRPRPAMPLLLIRQATEHSGDGDQLIATQLFAYDRAHDAFRPAFEHRTGRNNDQEVRYVQSGPLAGAVIVAEPTANAPFGFWLTVHRLGGGGTYRPVLRYRSITRYGDGNPLAVIDSDMPALLRRLGLWRPGQRLPTPPGCAAPRLVGMELWCGPLAGAR